MDFPLISGFTKPLSDCDWLDASRARAYARVLLAAILAGVVGWVALSSGGLDRQGKPIGTDFVGFYTAARFALAGPVPNSLTTSAPTGRLSELCSAPNLATQPSSTRPLRF